MKHEATPPWGLLKAVAVMLITYAVMLSYCLGLCALQLILFPVMVLEIFIEYKNKVIDLPDSSIRKKLMGLLYALFYIPFK
jgi:hypothetical protein